MWWASGSTAKSDTLPELIAGPIGRSSRPENVCADIGVSSSFSGAAGASFFAMTGIAIRATTISRIHIRFIGFPSLSEIESRVSPQSHRHGGALRSDLECSMIDRVPCRLL